MSFLNNVPFRRKILLFGIASVVITVVAIVMVVIFQVRLYEGNAITKINELTDINLQNITQGIYNLVVAQNESVQQQVDHSLNVARYILAQSGGISQQDETVHWTAVNQLNQQALEIDLPRMYLGKVPIQPNSDPAVETPLVDEVVRLVDGTATVFQRMNDAGDMLRVATNVPTKDGKRAVGTFIPATDLSGAPNPVVTAVLNGQIYRGLAYVVDAWYVTAYEPIYDPQNKVIGMGYVGVKQENITSLRTAIQQTKVARTGKVYVINGKGDARGRYVISPDGKQDGQSAWTLKDAAGGYPIQTIVGKALALQGDSVALVRYPWQEAGSSAPRWKVDQVAYFQPWDWVIVSEVYEDELLEYENTLKDGQNRLIQVTSFTGLGVLVLVASVLSLFALSLTRPLNRLTEVAAQIAAGDLSITAQAKGKDEIGILARAFNDMTIRLREMLSSEKAQRQRLESTVQTYVEHMERVAEGNLHSRVAVSSNGGKPDAALPTDAALPQDALTTLGEQLNTMTASLQEMIIQISQAANNLSTASAEILAAAIQQASGASEQSSAIAQTTVTVEQVKTIAEQASLRAQEVAGTALQTLQISQSGQQAVQDTVNSMGQIRGRVEDIASTIQGLSEQTRQISDIIATVNDIAEQSNLLAINAAVEAARVGEAGLGFAVVAEEMRSLAEQSRQATVRVRDILTNIRKAIETTVEATGEGEDKAEKGVRLAAQTGQVIEQLAATIQDAAQATEQLAAGGMQQRTGIEQIVQAMHHISEATNQGLTSTRQTEQSAQTLDELAKKMTETVGRYQL